ncbi:MAG: mitochondrial fission ELM1 family protein [Rhodospirillales bacterium]|nr:mitochondrial fission ELM1 family protein [Rhodospirillales bacterium]
MPIPTIPSIRTVWALTTGEAGKVSQAEGLAEALGWPFESIVVRLRRPWLWSPAHRQPPGLLCCGLEEKLPQPWPGLLISCGRRSVPVAAAVRCAAGGRTFAVHIQNPRTPLPCFDLIVPLEHDVLAGPNVVATQTALHRVTPVKLAAAGAEWQERLGNLNVAVLLGGRSRSYRFTRQTLHELAGGLADLDGDIAITPSRRTEAGVVDALRARLPQAWFWDGTGPNPYLGMLALARHIVVTEDSVSMISEAISTGKPVYVAEMAGGGRRLGRFHTSLREGGIVRPFDGRLARWRYEPVNETPRIAAEVRRRMGAAPAPWTLPRGMPLSQGPGWSATVPANSCVRRFPGEETSQ